MTKPEGPAQEPPCAECGVPRELHDDPKQYIAPATPAPSQPAGAGAGAAEFVHSIEYDSPLWDAKMSLIGKMPSRVFDDVCALMDEYARQQTAAKDAEAETFRCQLRDALKLRANVTWFGTGLLTAARAVVAERDSLREAAHEMLLKFIDMKIAKELGTTVAEPAEVDMERWREVLHPAALKAGKDGQQ